ncbi:MAG TPA: PilZ domain-containing protein [Epulopiscium sp.]|nr:PilZ domain-containing protein [Candidatus Epulonipiscium sp.]
MNSIQKSIADYYKIIMDDMNASARIIVEGKENKTYITTIIDWHQNNITFHAPLILGDYVRLLHDRVYPFVMITKACVYMTTVKIISFSKNKQGLFYYSGVIMSPLERNQQRQSFRLEWVEPFKYSTGKPLPLKKASTLDISVGGLRMACEDKISRNDSIHIEITLFDTLFTLEGLVLEELEKNLADLYVYRIQFHMLSQEKENLLGQLIMRRQRDMLKRL